MPHFIFLLSGVLLGTFAFINDRKNEASAETAIADTQALTENEIIDLDWEDIEYVDQIGLEIGYGLIPLVNEEDGGLMLSRVRGVRKKLSAELGFLIQPIRIRDNLTLSPTTYNILIKGAIRGTGTLMLGYELAINPGDISEPLEGIKTIEPAFGLDAYWVTKAQSDNAKTLGYTTVDPATVVATHLNAILRANASDLLGHDETREILDKVSTRSPKLIEDLVPDKLPVVAVMQVLKNILFESTSIRDIHTILDTLLTESGKTQNPDELTELVRPRLGRLMIQNIVSLGDVLNVITLDPSLEEILIRSLGQNVGGGMVIEPNLADGIIRSVGKQRDEAENIGHDAVIVVAPPIRPWLSRMLKQRFSDITVLSYTEIPEDQKIKVFARIGMTEETEGEAES